MEDTFTAPFTDVCVIVLIFLAVCAVFLKDREQGITPLLFSATGGRGRLFTAKIALTFALTALLALLFIGENCLIGALRYGLGDLTSPIQSVIGFYTCNLPLTVGQYLTLFVLVKILAYLVFAAVFGLIVSAAKNPLFAYGLCAAFCAVFLVLYFAVPESSPLTAT